MTTFELPKAFDEVKPAPTISEGVYKFALKQVTKDTNKAGTGENILIDLTLIGESEELNGIEFTQYLSLPNPEDEGRKTRSGQSMVDWKMEKIKKNVEALGGKIEGNKFSFPKAAVCKANVVMRKGEDRDEPFPWLDGDLMATEGGAKAPPKIKKS